MYCRVCAGATIMTGKNKVYRWTQDAVECYKRGCNCNGCFFENFFSGYVNHPRPKCKMKKSVLELVRILGKPDIQEKVIIKE